MKFGHIKRNRSRYVRRVTEDEQSRYLIPPSFWVSCSSKGNVSWPNPAFYTSEDLIEENFVKIWRHKTKVIGMVDGTESGCKGNETH